LPRSVLRGLQKPRDNCDIATSWLLEAMKE